MQFRRTMKATLSLGTVIAALALAIALQAAEPLKLSGTQSQKIVTLVRSTGPYLVLGTYDVPAQSELIIEAGAKLLFAKDAALSIQGTLLINGSKDAPVELTGKATGEGFWQGVRINRSDATRIDYARISGAKNGIYIHASKPSIDNTILVNNIVGLYVGKSGGVSEPSFMPLPLFLIRSFLRTKKVEYGASITPAKLSRVIRPF